jgi:quinolinate synthase
MGESAKILNPEKTVIIPDLNAKCPMAGMVDAQSLTKLQEQHPSAETVSYINTSAAVKALSDICCTSANGVNVVRSTTTKEVIFVPDTNLGQYIQRFITNKNMILWPGICPTHHNIKKEDLLKLKQKHPNAEILVHPECRPEVIDIANHTFSTNGMVQYVAQSNLKTFIIGTEKGLCYRLKKENPTKQFIPVESAVCPNMKKITLEKILKSLTTLEPTITLQKEILEKSKIPLQRMMNIGRGN